MKQLWPPTQASNWDERRTVCLLCPNQVSPCPLSGSGGWLGAFYSICSSLIIDEVYQARFPGTFSPGERALGCMHLLCYWILLKAPPALSFCVTILLFLRTTVDWKWRPFCSFSQEFWSLYLWHVNPLSPQTKATASVLRSESVR